MVVVIIYLFSGLTENFLIYISSAFTSLLSFTLLDLTATELIISSSKPVIFSVFLDIAAITTIIQSLNPEV